MARTIEGRRFRTGWGKDVFEVFVNIDRAYMSFLGREPYRGITPAMKARRIKLAGPPLPEDHAWLERARRVNAVIQENQTVEHLVLRFAPGGRKSNIGSVTFHEDQDWETVEVRRDGTTRAKTDRWRQRGLDIVSGLLVEMDILDDMLPLPD